MTFDADLVVIGGGSGGMAAAKAAASILKASGTGSGRVVLFDFVTPSPQGTKWGLGGTCVNVGCVPKKLFHHAANIKSAIEHDGPGYSITATPEVDFESLVSGINMSIKKNGFMYKVGLKSASVEYINAKARLTGDPNVVSYTQRGEEKKISAKNIILAVGGRPVIPLSVPGALELAITSDDIFWRKRKPGKTLVVGGSYIALECAGFIHHLQPCAEVEVAVRSIFLRGFDQQCASFVARAMSEQGVTFRMECIPTSLKKTDCGRIEVQFSDGASAIYDTVLYATGRSPDLAQSGAAEAGLSTSKAGKIMVDSVSFSTSRPDVFAIGDIIDPSGELALELTPVAIRQGEILARRMFDDSRETFDFANIATTVFTPVEYGCVGLSEEAAIQKFGEDSVEIFVWNFQSLEATVAHRPKALKLRENEDDKDQSPECLSKVVCDLKGKVLGIHFVGPNAGEVIQGFGVAMKTGILHKSHLDGTVGIHPTNAESLTTMEVTKRSGQSFVAAGGCGGGKCG